MSQPLTRWAQARQQTTASWNGLQARERFLISLAATAVGCLLVWTLALAPAWKLLRSAPAEHARLDEQLQRMQTLATQAQALQAQPRAQADTAQQALQAAVNRLGAAAQLSVAGDRATVMLKGASPQLVTQLLAQARQNARVLPVTARLNASVNNAKAGSSGNANANANATGASTAGAETWDGSIVFALPQPSQP